MFRQLKRVFISLIVAIIAFYPLFTPVAFAVDSWSGNPWTGDTWEGDPWEGKPWDGSHLQWEGNPWEGNGTEGDPWTGEGTQGEGWTGDPMQGINPDTSWKTLPWHLQGWTANGYVGNPWSQDGFSGSATTGNPWLQNGFNGSVTTGNPWLQNGFNGTGTQGNPWVLGAFNGNGTIGLPFTQVGFAYDPDAINGGINVLKSWNDQFINTINSDGYKTMDYLAKGVIQGQANLIGNFLTSENMKGMGFDSKFGYSSVGEFRRNILMNGLKLGLGDNILFDTYDTASNSKKLVKGTVDTIKTKQYLDAAKSAKDLSSSVDNAQDLANAAKVVNSGVSPPHPAAVGALSKFNIAGSAVGTVLSGIDTYNKIDTFTDVLGSNASTPDKFAAGADVGTGVGNTMMNASVAIAAVNPVLGLGVGAAGAGLWLASRGTKFVSKNWKGFNKKTVKSMTDSLVDSGKKTFDKIKGFFS
ncbi:hypothetical protein ACTWQB_01035 [Piscibacillus sp. B03]|uniref:hypothetical protein n=1 Tax=Piscibacillus sp. B03 TaxID=3457430 RepID=UPI003FCD409B